MANFYNSQNIVTNIVYEFPCKEDKLILKGLKKGELLISYNPSYIQNSNGEVSIDSRFTKFYILNEEKSIINTLELKWINNCEMIKIEDTNLTKNDYSLLNFILVIIIISIIEILRR